ncbi:hypothetical protein IQ270_06140 [Microcoleus sp. LEGE 07076]|nr:polymorphic toxin type 24 domain-containing protein [Microcoleus sp. LEGE 07076]MBE9184311.1 hypothetical protein [Microcoleus sp. LEGE 07076]
MYGEYVKGKAPANVPTPHAVEYKHNQNPAGDIFVKAEKTVRQARLDEI